MTFISLVIENKRFLNMGVFGAAHCENVSKNNSLFNTPIFTPKGDAHLCARPHRGMGKTRSKGYNDGD
jgi:hypothetical protein